MMDSSAPKLKRAWILFVFFFRKKKLKYLNLVLDTAVNREAISKEN